MAKFDWPVPLTTGTIVVVPAFGPTLAGLFAHDRSPVYVPVTPHAAGVFAKPSYVAEPLPAVAVTAAFRISKVFELLLPLWLASPANVALAVAVPAATLSV